jgi:hypothetical protein
MKSELQNGKWSEWISNIGNPNSDVPLGYTGSLDVHCEVRFANGFIGEGGFEIQKWSWKHEGVQFGYYIKEYRYWIPDTETQAEPKTEKEKDMNTWTDKDEEELNKLMVKKMLIESENKKKLESVVLDIHYYNITAGELTSEMIEHADELIESLQPYRKQK